MTISSLLGGAATPGSMLNRMDHPMYFQTDVDRGGHDEWYKSSKSDLKGKTSLSALTLLAFLFFLNMLLTCLKDTIAANQPDIIIMQQRTARSAQELLDRARQKGDVGDWDSPSTEDEDWTAANEGQHWDDNEVEDVSTNEGEPWDTSINEDQHRDATEKEGEQHYFSTNDDQQEDGSTNEGQHWDAPLTEVQHWDASKTDVQHRNASTNEDQQQDVPTNEDHHRNASTNEDQHRNASTKEDQHRDASGNDGDNDLDAHHWDAPSTELLDAPTDAEAEAALELQQLRVSSAAANAPSSSSHVFSGVSSKFSTSSPETFVPVSILAAPVPELLTSREDHPSPPPLLDHPRSQSGNKDKSSSDERDSPGGGKSDATLWERISPSEIQRRQMSTPDERDVYETSLEAPVEMLQPRDTAVDGDEADGGRGDRGDGRYLVKPREDLSAEGKGLFASMKQVLLGKGPAWLGWQTASRLARPLLKSTYHLRQCKELVVCETNRVARVVGGVALADGFSEMFEWVYQDEKHSRLRRISDAASTGRSKKTCQPFIDQCKLETRGASMLPYLATLLERLLK